MVVNYDISILPLVSPAVCAETDKVLYLHRLSRYCLVNSLYWANRHTL